MSHAAAEPYAPRLTTAVQWLIAINVAVFFLQLTVVSPTDMIALLGFRSGDLSRTWWTTVSYMFVHGGFWHVALNMYVLLLFGPRVEREWSAGEFARYFVMCGLGGLLMHLLFFRDATLVGASAAVYGVMLAYAKRWPDDEIYLFAVIPLKVKWLIALLVLTDLVSGLGGGATRVAHFAHLGGFLTGWLYLRAADAVRGDGLRARIAPVPDLGDETPRAIPRGLPRPRPDDRPDSVDDVVARSKAALAQPTAVRAAPRLPRPTAEPDLDHLLDKISRHGLESLTTDELRMLEEASRRMRER
ncbi:MAG TPA: rhomboid family intramembrane serine protease [Gemmatimonadales bacterium]